jgi:hypothetical protein
VAEQVYNAAIASWAREQVGRLPGAPSAAPGVQPRQMPPLAPAGPGNVQRAPGAPPAPQASPQFIADCLQTTRANASVYNTPEKTQKFVADMCALNGFSYMPPEGQ